jgi:hypothetical protein
VVAPRREVDQPLTGRLSPAGGERDPRRLGRDHRLEVDLVEQQRLQQLRLDPRRGDPHQRLAGERDRAFGHRVDVPGEAELRQIFDEPSAEPERAHVRQLLHAEAHLADQRQGGAEAGRQQPLAPWRQMPDEQLEHHGLVHLAGEVARRHRELVLVGQKRGLRGGQQSRVVRVRAHDRHVQIGAHPRLAS